VIALEERHAAWLSEFRRQGAHHLNTARALEPTERAAFVQQTQEDYLAGLRADYLLRFGTPNVGLCRCGLRCVLWNGRCVSCKEGA
jgi:hypothetical protein